jgi:glycosyltransferase involved in cell wall biosynthesis
LKKNILIISGFYPTNGILSLISYFSYSLISNKEFKKKYNLNILIFNENYLLKLKKFIFNIYLNFKNIFLNQKNRIHNYAYNAKQFIKDNPKLIKNIKLYSNEKEFIRLNPNLIFPIYFPIKESDINSIGYIYDFQHIDLPHLFTRHEINLRNKLFFNILKKNHNIIVNSNFVSNKLKKYFNTFNNKIIKIPFLPYIQNNMKDKNFNDLKKKYRIKKNFFIICNNFWKHKNHKVAFKAFSQFIKLHSNYQLVCTGDLTDSRHPKHFESITKKYNKLIEEKKILILGVIPKNEQICLLKNSKIVIQPTSYEGGPGGFSAYEAVAYKKTLLLSDIIVNKEIKSKNVFFFKENSSFDLLDQIKMIIKKNNKKITFFVVFYGIKNFILWVILKKYSFFLNYYGAYLQSRIYRGYYEKSVSYFKEKNSSDIIINIKEICTYFSSIYINSLINVFLEILLQISIIIMLLFFSWESTLLILVLFGGLTVLLYSYHKKRLNQLGLIRNNLSQSQLRNIQDGIGGIKEIKLLGREVYFLRQFEDNTNNLADANVENSIIAGTPRLIIEFFAICCISVIIILLFSRNLYFTRYNKKKYCIWFTG